MSVLTTTARQLSGALSGKVVMSGIQPTGVFHLGNILGAVQAWSQIGQRYAEEAQEIIYMVADLHSITVAKDPEVLRKYRWEALASLLACGIDPRHSNIYFQSQVPAHSQLHWLLSSVSSMGYLSRMTQWKSKSGIDASASVNQLANNTVSAKLGDVNLGLFSYPVLQAADVLINKADFVPVGEDQAQHLELTRHLCSTFNFRFGETFSSPKTLLTPFKKILSLRDPQKKMSKSDPDPTSCIYITDDGSQINAKLKRAVTDSMQGPIDTYDPQNRPAVSNLVMIASGLLNMDPQQFLDSHKPRDHRQLKRLVGDVITDFCEPLNQEYQKLVGDKAYLEEVAAHGTSRAIERTSAVYQNVAMKVGF